MKNKFSLNETYGLIIHSTAAIDLLLAYDDATPEQMAGVLTGVRSMLKKAEKQVDSLPWEVRGEKHKLAGSSLPKVSQLEN